MLAHGPDLTRSPARGAASRTAVAATRCDDPSMRRVLIVDDHEGFRRRARTLLEADGFDVVGEAASGVEGLAAAAALHPELVLLDVQLPDLDGFEVARRLRAAGACDAIVLTSSRDRCDYGAQLDECPASGFVPKAELSGERIAALLP
jgi:DNA-binding NarL/FixJ family response regulator